MTIDVTNYLGETPLASTRHEYRRLLTEALRRIRSYDGTEPSFQEVFKHLIALDEWMEVVFGDQDSIVERMELEQAIYGVLSETRISRDRTINGLLEHMNERFLKIIEKGDPPVLFIKDIDWVFLPPGDLPMRGKGAPRPGKIEYKPDNRLQQLLDLLSTRGIFLDDLVVVRGGVYADQIRKVPYVLVEIPRINRQVLICDQFEEATFVIRGQLSHEVLLKNTKESLQETYGSLITRVPYASEKVWRERIEEALFEDNSPVKKIDVRIADFFKEEVRARYTAADWVAMSEREKLDFRLHGKGLEAISTILGVRGNPACSKLIFFEIGVLIFGVESEEIAPLLNRLREEQIALKELGEDPEKWAAAIRKLYTVQEWIALPVKKMRAVLLHGVGIARIGKKLGLKILKRAADKYFQIEFAAKVYGDEYEFLEPILKESRARQKVKIRLGKDPVKWAEEIRKIYSLEEWLGLSVKEKFDINIHGKAISALGTIFGYTIRGAGDYSTHLEMAALIYGEDNETLKPLLKADRAIRAKRKSVGEKPEDWAKEIQKFYTSEQWVSMEPSERQKVKVHELGIVGLVKKLGLKFTKGRAFSGRDVFILIGAVIFGEDDPNISKFLSEARTNVEGQDRLGKDPIKWAEELRARFTRAEWISMNDKKKSELKIFDIGLAAISRILGKEAGIPNIQVHGELADLIFGKEDKSFEDA